VASNSKQVSLLAKQLTKLSIGADGAIEAERVTGVLAYLEKHKPARPVAVLKAYHRLIGIELAKTHAIVEHAGEISDTVLGVIAGAMSQKYHRSVSATSTRNDSLIAGLRIRVADDVYESTVSGQLDSLALSL
jgi:F-type H+-transporting ATPase subunit delta